MQGFSKLRVAHKLGLAACAFAIPIAFMVWALVGEQNISIRFAIQEIAGARYLTGVMGIQGEAALLALKHASDAPGLSARLVALEATEGPGLDAASQSVAASAAFATQTAVQDGRPKLRDLIVRVGDRSNLILDNVLGSYYLTDVVLNRLPDTVDRIADLSLAREASTGDIEARAKFLVELGGLVADLDGIDASLLAAEQAEGGAAIKAALDADVRTLRASLDVYVTELKIAGETVARPEQLVEKTAFLGRKAAETLTAILSDRVTSLRASQLLTLGLTALLSALALGAMMFAVLRMVVSPLARLSAATRLIAEGLLDTGLPKVAPHDEVGTMSAAVEGLRRQCVERKRLEADAVATQALRERQQASMERHTRDFGASVSGVLTTLGKSTDAMRHAADEMAHAVERTRSGSVATAAGAEENARNLGTVASATEQLSASVNEIARQAAEAATAAGEAVRRADAMGITIRDVSDAAGQIETIVRLISDVASRTNLLALNATIEAARAGDAGKGFAVVASEVKQLAAQTAKATQEIGSQIDAMRSATQSAVGTVAGVGETIGRMDRVISSIAAAVEQQGAATREIAASVLSVSQQNEVTTNTVREVAAVAESATGSSLVVLDVASGVSQVSNTLRDEVDQFLAAMRTDPRERRQWERVPGHSERVVVIDAKSRERFAGQLVDISRGGASIDCQARVDPGADLLVDLGNVAGGAKAVGARAVRTHSTILALAFRQDEPTLEIVDRALAAVSATGHDPKSLEETRAA